MPVTMERDEADRLAREPAERTGESETTVVISAVRERLDRVRRSLDEHHAERILALGKDFAAYLAAPYGSADHCDRLSDECGQYVLEHASITAGALLEGLDETRDDVVPEHYGEGYFERLRTRAGHSSADSAPD